MGGRPALGKPVDALGCDCYGPPVDGWALAAVVLVLVACAALSVAVRRWAGTGGRFTSSGELRIIDRALLTPGVHALVVEIAGRRLLLASGPSGVQLLRPLTPSLPEPPTAPPGPRRAPLSADALAEQERWWRDGPL